MTSILDNPYSAYQISGSAISYADITGRGNTATSSPALPVSNSFIVSHNTSPAVIGGTNNLVIPYNRFSPGWENSSFTLECWYDSLTTGAMGIMSHIGATDGIYFDGNNITFGVDMYMDSSLIIVDKIRASWPVPNFKSAYHIAGVYDTSKVSLYIDGVLQQVVEVPVDKKNNGFVTLADTKLYCGQSVAGQSALFDLPAIYSSALSNGNIATHFSSGRSSVKSSDIATNRGAALWKLTDIGRNTMFNNTLLFEKGLATGTIIRNGLRPAYSSTLLSLVNCKWQTIIGVSGGFTGTMSSAKLSWDGSGSFIVETSLNAGVSWSAAVNGGLIAGSIGLAVTNLIDVRITFAGGVAADASVVRDISAVVYSDGLVRGTDQSRALTLVGNVTTSDQDTEPMKRYANAGSKFISGGYMTISQDNSSTPRAINSIELFLTFSTTTASQYLFDLGTSQTTYLWLDSTSKLSFVGLATLYINGISYATGVFTPAAGQEYHIMAILSTPLATTSGMVIGANYLFALPMTGRVSLFALYPTVITDVSTVYNSYNGVPRVSIADLGSIGVQESITPVAIYSNVWPASAGVII